MSQVVRVPLVDHAMLLAIAQHNRVYAQMIRVELDMLETRARRGEFALFREARHVLWHFGRDGGMQPGGFVRSLLNTLDAASVDNRQKLVASFPEYVTLFEIMQLVPDGADRLRRLVDGEQG